MDSQGTSASEPSSGSPVPVPSRMESHPEQTEPVPNSASRTETKMPLSGYNMHNPPGFSQQLVPGSSNTSNSFGHGLQPSTIVQNVAADFPPPLPIPVMGDLATHRGTSAMPPGTPLSMGLSSDSLISQFAGVAMNAGIRGRANSRGPETTVGMHHVQHNPQKKQRPSPEKIPSIDPRAAQHGIVSSHPRLKVEDALGYLDQVKIIFGHRPKVYNDFLDIMKEFKSQSLDTPGVITRVASLFRGHSDLIVGFNSFLPHGYKIDIDHDEIIRVTVPGNQVLIISSDTFPPSPATNTVSLESHCDQQHQKSQSPTSTVSVDSEGGQKLENLSLEANFERAEHLQADMDSLYSTYEPSTAMFDLSARGAAPSKGVEFDYAINYVNKIKARFIDEPDRYKRFLEILHAYQGKVRLCSQDSRPVDETDVSKEVSLLFRDHADLMDDFSRFLPACSIGGPVTPIDTSTRALSPSPSASPSPQLPITQSRQAVKGKSLSSAKQQGKAMTEQSVKIPITAAPVKSEVLSKLPGKVQKDGEKKNRGSKAKHNDEPEAVETPKTPLKRFVKQRSQEYKHISAESTKKMNRGGLVDGKPGRTKQESPVPPSTSPMKLAKTTGIRVQGDGCLSDYSKTAKNKRRNYRVVVPSQRKGLKRLTTIKKVFRPTRLVTPAEAFAYATLDDFALMDRIRRSVHENVFNVMLKIFEIYTSRAITKGKLLQIMEKLLYHKPKLVQEFAALLQTKAAIRSDARVTLKVQDKNRQTTIMKAKEPESRIAEIDFKAFERFTDSHSYRIRPDHFPKRKSSGSTPMDKQVLNDKYVSCPIFSEGSQFLISKKNGAEEVMFKCEDEKYEMDMLLAGAGAAIDAMSFMLERISTCSVQRKSVVKWEGASLHRRIITKLYTDNAPFILDHLVNNPACAIHTVLERLKQKHLQWIRVQNSMGEIWMDHARRNASKIGDYKGGTFKQIDMRFLRSRHLVHEMEKLYSARLEKELKLKKQKSVDETQNGRVVGGEIADEKPDLTVAYPKSSLVVDDVSFFILRYIKQCSAFTSSDKKHMNKFLLEYVYRCLNLPDSTDPDDFQDSSDDETDSDGKSPRARRPSVPRLLSSSSDEDETNETSRAKRNYKTCVAPSDNSDEETPGSNTPNGPKSRTNGPKEFAIAPLPWPELCQYSIDFKPLDAQVDEDLSTESKKREINRQRIVRKLGEIGDKLPDDESSYVVLYGSSVFFLFVRYHQVLCDRLGALYRSFQNSLTVETGKLATPACIVSRASKPRIDLPVERYWIVFVDRLLKLLDGNLDAVSYEEEMREIFGKDAYLAFTLDRLIQSIARQLHHVIAQERAKIIRNLWEDARMNGGAGGPMKNKAERSEAEKHYEGKVSEFLKDQNCFKIVAYNSGRITIELIDSEEPEDQQPSCRNWKDFVAYHASASRLDEPFKAKLTSRQPVFLTRYHRQLSRHRGQLTRSSDDDDEEEEEDLVFDTLKLSDPEAPADLSLDDRSWLMTLNIRSQIESDDILGYKDDRVPGIEWLVYRRGALEAAEESHRRVSQRRTTAFKRYLTDVWMKKALITQEKHKVFLSLMRENMNRYKQGNSVGAPYFVYYVCKSDESERLEQLKPFWEQEADDVETAADGKEEEIVDTAVDSDSSEDDTETESELKPKRMRITPADEI